MRAREILAEANLINTEAVKNNYLRLTAEQHMAGYPDLQAWFLRAGFRYIQQLPLDSDAIKPASQSMLNDPRTHEECPWLQAALDRGDEVGFFSPSGQFHERVRGMLDWLVVQRVNGVRLNLDRLSFAQALEHAEQWHREMAERNARQADQGDDIKGLVEVMKFKDDFRWVQLKSAKALKREGTLMQHCVGEGGYTGAVKSGRTRIYSLRDPQNQPHCTIEVESRQVNQVKGKQNKAPVEKYVAYVRVFLQALKLPVFGAATDLRHAGLIQRETGDIEALRRTREEVTLSDGAVAIIDTVEDDEPSVRVRRRDHDIAQVGLNEHGLHTLSTLEDRGAWEVPLEDVRSVAEALNHIRFPVNHAKNYHFIRFGLIHTGTEWQATGASEVVMALDDGTQVVESRSSVGHWYHFIRNGVVLQMCLTETKRGDDPVFRFSYNEARPELKPWLQRSLPETLNTLKISLDHSVDALGIFQNRTTGRFGSPMEIGRRVADLPGSYQVFHTAPTDPSRWSNYLCWFDQEGQERARFLIAGRSEGEMTPGKPPFYVHVTKLIPITAPPEAIAAGLTAFGGIGPSPHTKADFAALGIRYRKSNRQHIWELDPG
jgi:hypothetical protein